MKNDPNEPLAARAVLNFLKAGDYVNLATACLEYDLEPNELWDIIAENAAPRHSSQHSLVSQRR